MNAFATGGGRVYQASGDQYIYEVRTLPAAVVVPVAAQYAAAPSVFVGRTREVSELLSLLDPTRQGPGTAVVSVVAGIAGVGKTALARHVASIAVGRGWFPGGAIFTDLHGYDTQTPITPGQVFGPALRMLEENTLPVDDQAAAYHWVLAERAKEERPVLLVLDNVSSTAQIGNLLPMHRAHRVLVTSRHTLGELDSVRVLELDALAEAEAVAVLEEVLRQRNPADRRVQEQAPQARELAHLCGRLPLALRIAAALLADNPGQPLTALNREFADTDTRLDGLAYGERSVCTAFDLSWRHLTERDEQSARLFRLLSGNPGRDISTEGAAAMADRHEYVTNRCLANLRRAHLIEQGTTPDRWRMHDLVRLYGGQLAEPDELQDGINRLLGFYLAATAAADDHLRAPPGHLIPGRFTGREQAVQWLETERPNLVAAVTLAAATGRHEVSLALPLALSKFLHLHYPIDHIAMATIAAQAASHLDDRHGEGIALADLGAAQQQMGQDAINSYRQAASICQETSYRHRTGMALANLRTAVQQSQRLEEATTAYQHTVGICRETSNLFDFVFGQIQQAEAARELSAEARAQVAAMSGGPICDDDYVDVVLSFLTATIVRPLIRANSMMREWNAEWNVIKSRHFLQKIAKEFTKVGAEEEAETIRCLIQWLWSGTGPLRPYRR